MFDGEIVKKNFPLKKFWTWKIFTEKVQEKV